MNRVYKVGNGVAHTLFESEADADAYLKIAGTGWEKTPVPVVPRTSGGLLGGGMDPVDEAQQTQIDDLLRMARKNRLVDIVQWVLIGFLGALYVFGHFLGGAKP